MARVKAIFRRMRERSGDRVYKIGSLELDTGKYLTTVKGKSVELTSKEYELLKSLLESEGRALSRGSLLKNVWGYQDAAHVETRTVDMHIGQLRKKLQNEGKRIITVKNVGYRIETG